MHHAHTLHDALPISLGRVIDRPRCVSEEGAEAGDKERDCHELSDGLEAVRAGRRFVHRRAVAFGARTLADDAALVAAELLANAVQHGEPPVVVCLRGAQDRLSLEVRDASSRSPVRPAPSTSNMTGRGLALVEALTTEWGIRREPDGGKTVWCELRTAPDANRVPEDLGAVLAQWEDDSATTEQ